MRRLIFAVHLGDVTVICKTEICVVTYNQVLVDRGTRGNVVDPHFRVYISQQNPQLFGISISKIGAFNCFGMISAVSRRRR